ncbi:MAG: TonB-dependent receptor [Pseudomonadota bacterium]|nr:TonB-dependent receptor [Pseudomonadota bacterium]
MGGRWGVLLAVGGIVLSYSSGVRAQSCEPAAASVISIQGDVEVSESARANWQDVQLNQVLCGGQQVRLMAKSRAVLQLPNETLLHLDEGSVLTLQAVAPEKPAWLEFLRGAVHIISRVPRALNIRTPFVNAGIEGTEFALQVGKAEAALWVYEGRVRFSNALGQLLIASGEAAAAAPGRAPERRIVVKPRQAVEWALYYPPLLDSRPETYPEVLRPAVLGYRQNDFPAAFAALDGVPEGARDARYYTLRAGLLLSVGRVPEAEGDLTSAQRLDPKNGTAYALRSVIAVVRNEQEEALKLAAEAVRLAPGSATPYVARSYAEQSAFEIEKAHESLQKAAELAPEDALVWARLAELELSLGDLDAALESARKAEQLDPGLSRTQSVLGFAYLTRIEVDRAKTAFERALVLDPADPLPRLGLGLAKIRDGDVDAGTKEIETAASLDPNNSLVRSYLGKAYYEQKRGALASTEFEQAKLLDPKDPTPWFYDAIQKQTTNRPVEALHDLEAAIERNDNRAVYRSKFLLDQDLAARSASLGRIYRDLGFEQLGRLEAWESVNRDPGDYSGHRLLADTYARLQRHDIARVSELLQSQLLQPVNLTPLQPQLAETALQFQDGAGPAEPSFNEFNPLFTRNRWTAHFSGIAGGHRTIGDELTVAGLINRYSLSVGQFHYETDGYRTNNDVDNNIYSAFGQVAITPRTNLQVELRHQEIFSGVLVQSLDDPETIDETERNEIRRDTARFGLHHSLSNRDDFIASVIYRDNENDKLSSDLDIFTATGAYSLEGQYQRRGHRYNSVAGLGHFDQDRSRTIGNSAIGVDAQHTNAYLYSYLALFDNLIATLGVSYDAFDGLAQDLLDLNRINPKVGIWWQPSRSTTLRAAWFTTVKRPFASNQTVEPTHVAGFNQFFDDTDGSKTGRYGIGIDHEFNKRLYAGLEVSWRDLERPLTLSRQGETVIDFEKRKEQLHRAYIYLLPTDRIAISAEYFLEDFDRDLIPDSQKLDFTDFTSHRAPFSIRYFDPTGLFGGLTATYVNQDVELTETRAASVELEPERANSISGNEDFWVLDLALGYRLPKRWGLVTFGIKNLLDEEFRFQDTQFSSNEPTLPLFQPDRVIFTQFTLAY